MAPKTPTLLVVCLFFLFFGSGCVNRFDPELSAYVDFRNAHRQDLETAFQGLADDEKIRLFFGAMKMEPPALEVESLVAAQPYPFLVKLRAEILKRKGFVETYSLNNAIIEMSSKGRISREQINSLHLKELCVSTDADAGLCDHQIAIILSKSSPSSP